MPAKVFTWEEIRDINEDSYRAGLPDQTDPKAIEIMNQISVKHWKQPMGIFLFVSHKLVKDMLMEQLHYIFSQYYQTPLYGELKRIIDKYLETLQREHHRHALEIYNIEHNKPFTTATSFLELEGKEAFRFLSTQRRNARAHCYLDAKFPRGDPRREAEFKKITDADLGPDKFAQELKMMAVSCPDCTFATRLFVLTITRLSEGTIRLPAPVSLIPSVRAYIQSCSPSAVRSLFRSSSRNWGSSKIVVQSTSHHTEIPLLLTTRDS